MSTDNKQFQWTEDKIRDFAEYYRKTQGTVTPELWGKDLLEVWKSTHATKEKFNWVVYTKEGFGYDIWNPKDWRGDKGSNWDESVKTFASLQEANEYVLLNKPFLSLEEIMRHYIGDRAHDFYCRIKKVIESKPHQGE